MESLQHVLAPVDFSGLSALGLRYAAALARCSGARLTALYADPFEPPPYFTEGSLDTLRQRIQDSKAQAAAYLDQFVADTLGAEAQVDAVVEEGLPADAIRRAVNRLDAGLVVMGTHGRSGVNRLMLGSVTERVLRETTVPVLAVRGQDSEIVRIERILCPVNDSGVAREALRIATGLARCLGATVNVLHVRQSGASDSIADLCNWIPESERSLCSVTELGAAGDLAREVIAVAAESHSDLLVLGARHRRFADTTILGANTIRMLRHAPCPVLAVFTKEERA